MQVESLRDVSSKSANVFSSYYSELFLQIKLMLWKRNLELSNQKYERLKYVLPPLLSFALVALLYSAFDLFNPGTIEEYFIPISTWVFVQKVLVAMMYEKSSRLQESMRMMGMHDSAYWLSYFISDGVILGGLLSFLCAIVSLGGLFNGANFIVVFGFYFLFCMSAVCFNFFVAAFFDTPQTSGQAILAALLGFYVIYLSCYNEIMDSKSLQRAICLFPPLALQLASGSFKLSYTGIDISTISGIMFADIVLYSVLAWYFAQVWPSKIGVPKPFYFIVDPSYWFSPKRPVVSALEENILDMNAELVEEQVDPKLLGIPTVEIRKLSKTFGSQRAVNNLSLNMYPNQIFVLLGHNGAGKTTTINMLTGLNPPDYSVSCGAFIYGNSISTEMNSVRRSMGVCPQHDVLFENLTVQEHILFFAQLKGVPYAVAEKEAQEFTTLFHLEKRRTHLGSELSGGQKRKLSVAIAVCGGSKFVVLDEPTAGMDPLARRELWDLLSSLRIGRTMLLTTHYMDEADILGDRVAIMSLGQLECIGSPHFLKQRFGPGYKLIFNPIIKGNTEAFLNHEEVATLTKFVLGGIPGAAEAKKEANLDNQLIYILPFSMLKNFGDFFMKLEDNLVSLKVSGFGISLPTLEDVFLTVGADESVRPRSSVSIKGIGSERRFNVNFTSQVIGLVWRKLTSAKNDFTTIPLLILPSAAAIAGAIIYSMEVITGSDWLNDLFLSGIYAAAYLAIPGLIAEFIVRERETRLRNVLSISGCGIEAYWLGTFIADYIMLLVPTLIIFLTWFSADLSNFYSGKGSAGAPFFVMLLFNMHLICFSYITSNMFTSPKSCIAFLPMFVIFLIFLPNIIVNLIIVIFVNGLALFPLSFQVAGGILVWGTCIFSPHGALFAALLASAADTDGTISDNISYFPPVYATVIFMIAESLLYIFVCIRIDMISIQELPRLHESDDPSFDPRVLEGLDEDVVAERNSTQIKLKSFSANALLNAEAGESTGRTFPPLCIDRLRKVFPPKRAGAEAVVATEDACFSVESGEIFGLLGANGAGKSTLLSMLVRHLIPNSGDAQIVGNSILSSFREGSTHLGIVTQTNSLWDLLSVEDHLYLFARIRGIPEANVKTIVEAVIDQLELRPHKNKLALRLSGGMKRKLCVAIALIGDPEVVLLDEPSAGLDPVSRRNLWNVILRTMSERAVILTTHSMEEAEALCKRIGIMVKGQLRALGTKQHLKLKFGQGYEITMKLIDHDIQAGKEILLTFLKKYFPSTEVVAENGGLLTFRVSKDEIKIGRFFKEIELNKEYLQIEDYSVSQPTLEQVFIRTVIDHEAVLARSDHHAVEMSIVVETNKCGFTRRFSFKWVGVAFLIWIICIIAGLVAKASAAFAFGTISFIVMIIGCMNLYCPCLQKPKDLDE